MPPSCSFPPTGVLSWHKADPRSKVTACLEYLGISDAGNEGARQQRADAWDLHQPLPDFRIARSRADTSVVLQYLLRHDRKLRPEHLQADAGIGRNPLVIFVGDYRQQALEPNAPPPALRPRTPTYVPAWRSTAECADG